MQLLRLVLRRIILVEARLQISRARKFAQRCLNGQQSRLAGTSTAGLSEPAQLTITQPIFKTELSANKTENLRRAASEIAKVVVPPGGLLSFWAIVPRPTIANGYTEGRSLIDGELVGKPGGGLCQLSGIIYHISLLAGLKCLERHAHSVDLYTEETRFTPIGTDATIVYGYKDLLIENTMLGPLSFEFEIEKNALTCRLLCATSVSSRQLKTQIQTGANGKQVTVHRVGLDGVTEAVPDDFYKTPIDQLAS